MSALAASAHPDRRRHRADPADHLPRQNRIALQSELMGAAALGIRNILVLTGDDPKAGDQPDAKPVFDVDSRTCRTARQLRDEGKLPTGREVARQGGVLHRRRRHADRSAGGWKPSGLQPKSPPAPNSCRPSSAWMPALLRRYVDALARRRHDQAARHAHRRQSAALGEVGATG